MVAGIAVLAVAGACAQREQPGVPSAGPTGATSAAARPAELPLDGVTPCDLVTGEMRDRFAIDRPDAADATDPDAPGCTFISSTVGRYVVAVVRGQGVGALGRPVGAAVGGFPAVEIRRPEIQSVCHYSIDVAEGQRLDVEIQRRDRTVPPDQLCADTLAFAEAVLANLRHKLGR